MAEKKNWLQRLYTAVRGQVDEPRVMTIEDVRKHYGPAVTLGAPEEIQVAQDAALCDAGVYSLIQHSFQLGQPPITEFVGYGALQAMSQNGLLRACIETVSDDMTREWIELKRDTSNPDYDENGEISEEEQARHEEEQKEADTLIAEMNQAMKKYHLQDVFHLAQTLVGYEGGALIFIDTGAVGDELKTPLNLSNYSGELRMGDLKGFRVIDPVNVFPGLYNSTDPLREDYFVPETWWILGQEVHKSRLVRLVSNEVPLLLKPSYNFLGIAQAQILWDYVLHFQQCRVAAADLVTKHSTTVFKTSIGDILFSGQGTQVLDTRIAYFKKNRDNLNIVAIDRETEDLVNVDAPVSGVDMICKQALEYLAAINRTPAVKLLGISPSGFNATGESDIRNYYDHILSQQEKVFRAGIQTCLDVLQLNLNGKIDKSLTFEFAKLSEEDKNTRVMYQKSKADVIGGLLDHQIISGEEARKALADDPDSGFTDLDPDEVPEAEGGGMPDMAGIMGGEESPNEENPVYNSEKSDKIDSADGAPYGNTNAAKNHTKKADIRGVEDVSPQGENNFTVRGFPTRQKLMNHYKNGRAHGKEYPEYDTPEKYEQAALALLESKCGGDIVGHVDKDGVIIRYNRKTNDFAKGHPDKGVRTMYKPEEGEEYYLREKSEDLDYGGRE